METDKIPGYTGYQFQYKNENDEANGFVRDNRYFIPGYAGYVPSVKAENAFGESFGKHSGQSVTG